MGSLIAGAEDLLGEKRKGWNSKMGPGCGGYSKAMGFYPRDCGLPKGLMSKVTQQKFFGRST